MNVQVKCAMLLGRMLEVIRGYNDDVAEGYEAEVEKVVGELAGDCQGREALWGAMSRMSGVAGFAAGALEVTCDADRGADTNTVERARTLFDAATEMAGVVALEAAK